MKLLGLKLIGLFLFLGTTLNAQVVVRGVVKDAKSQEGVFNATIKINGAGKAKTDFDGAFSLQLNPGTYTLTVTNTAEGYIDHEEELVVADGAVINLSIQLGREAAVLEQEQVVVTGYRNTSQEGADNDRAEDPTTTEKMPKEKIVNSGAQDAVDAVQQTPGASVEDGKNVYIRGLGDRYTKTILNGMDIPGLDPDRNSVQMDIFPAVLIDNITVYKTFTPNLTADFTGGLINIETKEFPGRKTIYAKAGLGYNTNATFNSDFISYEGGSLDFLGFDDGTRALPISPTAKIPHPASNDPVTHTFTSAFSQTMATQKAMAFLNQSYAFGIGNQINVMSKKDSTKKKFDYGYNVALNYRNWNNYFKDVEYNEFLRDPERDVTELFRDRTSRGELATNDVMWTGLVGNSVKFGRSKIGLVLFHTQSATSSAANLTETNYDSNQATLVKQGLQYQQRSITNANLSGLHYLDSLRKWKMNWNVSPTYSRISDPDIRSTALEISDIPGPNGEDVYIWEESVGAEVRRIFRSLNEYNVSAKIDFEYKFMQWDSLTSKLAFGLLNTYKNRSFDVNEYVFRIDGPNTEVPNDPNWFFMPENLWTPEKGEGVYATGQQEKANLYDANQMISAAYVMNELPLSEKFHATYGARVERNVNYYTGQSNNADTDPTAPRYDNEEVLNAINVLPSLNMTYKIRKDKDSLHAARKTNFRAAYTQTLARPSFREISISQIYDPIQGRRYLGNINLEQTLIHNADLRWESFFGRTELISASAFYKKFINPIEIVANVAAPNEFMPVNTGNADVYGAEFEIRKAIGFKESTSSRFEVGANFTYVYSAIDMRTVKTEVGGVEMTEYDVRLSNARTDANGNVIEDIPFYRPMFGQSPYIINAYMTYKQDSIDLIFNLTYNVQGKKLAVIGIGNLPDVYEQPFHSLNMKVSKKFGKIHKDKGETQRRWQASLRASNLLNNARRRFYEAYDAESQIFDYLHQGTSISGSISFTIQ